MTAYTDATTGATPLALMKQAIYGNTDALSQIPDALSLLIGQNGGCLGEVSALALLIGLAYMLWKKIITWHIPVSILVTVFVFAGIMHLADPEKYVSPVLQLLSGGLMLGAVFMATDYVTSPMSKKGMLIYGVCIGLLTVVIRLFGAYPENICTAPLEYFEEFCGLQGNGNRQIFWIVELFPVTVISEFQNLFYCFFCHFSYSCSAAFFNASLNWSSHAYMYKPFTPRVIRTRISCFSNSFAKFCFVPSSMVLFLVTFPLLVSLGS